MKLNNILFILAFNLICMQGFTQVQISFQPAIHGNSLDGLTYFQINNLANNDFNASIRIIISEEKAGKIAEISSPSVYIKRGITSFNRSAIGILKTKFSSNPVAAILRQTGKLPEGEYEYCYELSPVEEKSGIQDYYENCFDHNLLPLSPLLLIDPMDEEKICNQKPSFTWQSPMPVNFNARYRIIVVERKENQTAAEALSFNLPLINVSGLSEPRMNFPMNIKELEKGKTYVWQIYYSVNNMLLTRSEMWTFKIECDEEIQGNTDDSYREVKTQFSGDFYVATTKLRFAVDNPYSDGDLVFKIIDLNEMNKPIKNLPQLKIATGLNKYELDLSGYRDFKDKEHYQLEVQLPNGQKLYLRFTYRE